jgi:hypothetical protein
MRTFLAVFALSILPVAAGVATPGMALADNPPYQFDPKFWQLAVVTEVMVDPVGAPADTGQWIEIANLGSEPVNLQGMVLTTRSGGFHVISPSQPLILDPAGTLVMGRLAEPTQNGGVPVGYAYGSDLLLAQEGEFLLLLWNNTAVDFATWGNGVEDRIEPGHSWSLEPPAPDGTGFKEWCPGRNPYGTGVDRGTPAGSNEYCDNDGDGLAEDQDDCDDTNASVGPGMPELCNGVDDDCDGLTDEDVPPLPVCLDLGVCAVVVARCDGAAGFACDYPSSHQAVETRCDGLDNDCDGLTDEDLQWKGLALGAACIGPGVCGAGTVVCSPLTLAATCSTLVDGTTSLAGPERCNGLDDNCNGFTDEDFALGQDCAAGLGACARAGHRICNPEGGTRCDVDPGLPESERCGDRIDNDCDGDIDEGFPVGENCWVGLGACRAVGKLRCAEDALSVTCMASPGPATTEACGDGIDNDCDGTLDEADCVEAARASSGCAAGGSDAPVALLVLLLGVSVGLARLRRRPRA